MKNDKKLIGSLILCVLILSVTFGFVLFKYVNNGNNLLGSISGVHSTLTSGSSASASSYKDWSELTSIDNDYSYSTLFYTKDTKFYVNASEGANITYSLNGPEDMVTPYIELLDTNKSAQVIITNCGVDKEGNVLSAVLDIAAIDVWDHHVNQNNYTRGYVHFNVGSGYYVPRESQSNPSITREQTGVTVDYNLPIRFNLNTEVATAKVRLTYYKNLKLKNVNDNRYGTPHGSVEAGHSLAYAEIDEDQSTVATNITKINSFYSDLDIPRSLYRFDGDTTTTQYTDKVFEGREGIAPANGSTKIYYTKNGKSLVSGVSPVPGATTFDNSITNNSYSCPENSTSNCEKDQHAPVTGYTSVQLKEGDNGIFCRYSDLWKYWFTTEGKTSEDANIDGIWFGQSTEFLTENVQGIYEFTYSGSSNGSIFMFFTPNGYETDNPIKSVNKTEVVPGEEFEYSVMQYIPNNYFTNIVDFNDVYDTMPENNYLTSFSFEDEIDSRLTILADGITIVDINENDLTEYFNINVEGNRITTTEKDSSSSFYQTAGAYNNYYILKIPVKYEGEVETEIIIPNKGKTTLKIGDRDPKTTETNEVTTRIVQNGIKLTYDCETNGGVATFTPTTKNETAGADVDLTPICKRDGYKFVGWAEKPNDRTNMTEFKMPNHDTTIYGLYTPVTCDLLLTSSSYKIDYNNKTIYIPIEESNSTILKNISSKGDISFGDEVIIVKCDGEEQRYKINRFWIAKTGGTITKWTLLITGFALVAVLGILVRISLRKTEK